MAEKHKRKIFTTAKRALAKFGIVPIVDGHG
jgi:hypothetical protein